MVLIGTGRQKYINKFPHYLLLEETLILYVVFQINPIAQIHAVF